MTEAFGGVMGMAICNDRRWSETYRVMGLQGVEMVMIGYNTPVHNPPAPEHDDLSLFHNHLVMQAGAYQNGTFVVGVAKAGVEEGVDHIGGSCVTKTPSRPPARSSRDARPRGTRSRSPVAISISATPTSAPLSISTFTVSRTPTG
ncbi:putative amidohydrolase [Bradyrhizobium sp. GM6.1]